MSLIITVLYGAIVSIFVTPILLIAAFAVYDAMPCGVVPVSIQNSVSLAMSEYVVALGLLDISGWISLMLGFLGGE
ncbi:MAG TPA: hypothetical protein P5168_01340 [Candidatus Methanomethylicus sp.]|nr:hypothetical protein [Candidatus Methanomethylicus sp.]